MNEGDFWSKLFYRLFDRDVENGNIMRLLLSMKPENVEMADNLMIAVGFGAKGGGNMRMIPRWAPERMVMAMWLCHVFSRAVPVCSIQINGSGYDWEFRVLLRTTSASGHGITHDITQFIHDFSASLLDRFDIMTESLMRSLKRDAGEQCWRHFQYVVQSFEGKNIPPAISVVLNP